MADPNVVNPQITDAVTQTTVKVLAESPSTALGVVYQLLSQAVGLAMQNSTSHQHSMQQVSTATTTAAVQQILYAGSRFQVAPIAPPPPPPAPPPPASPAPAASPASSTAGGASTQAGQGTSSGTQGAAAQGTSQASQQTPAQNTNTSSSTK